MQDKFINNYLNRVNRPFDFIGDGRIPDGLAQNTVQLIDFYDSTPFSLPATSAATTAIYAVGFYSFFGNNASVLPYVYNCNISPAIINDDVVYCWCFFGLDVSGQMVSATLTAIPQTENQQQKLKTNFRNKHGITPDIKSFSKSDVKVDSDQIESDDVSNYGASISVYWTYGFANYGTIMGNSTSTADAYDSDAMVTGLRTLGFGMRIWPTIERVTDSSTLAVAKYYGCSMTPFQLNRCNFGSQHVSLYTAMKECPGFWEGNNSEGITIRFNPFQRTFLDFTKMFSLQNLTDPNITLDDAAFPLIVVQLTAPINWTTTATACPFNIMIRHNFEAVLNIPTPIVSSRPPLSLELRTFCDLMGYDSQKFPIVVSGHTFKVLSPSVWANQGPANLQALRYANRNRIMEQGLPFYDDCLQKQNNNRKQKNKRRKNQNKSKQMAVYRGGYRGRYKNFSSTRGKPTNTRGGLNYLQNSENMRQTIEPKMFFRKDLENNRRKPRGKRGWY